jgi:hypothetical protein
MPWDKQVDGCFGGGFFASHPYDEDRAFEWLADLRKRRSGWKTVEQQLREYMESKKFEPEHIESQVKTAERYMKPWLAD